MLEVCQLDTLQYFCEQTEYHLVFFVVKYCPINVIIYIQRRIQHFWLWICVSLDFCVLTVKCFGEININTLKDILLHVAYN